MKDEKDWDKHWTDIANSELVNRKIVKVRYFSQKEADDMGWTSRPVAMLLDNGVWIFPSADDEGNDGGALFTTSKQQSCIPVLR